MFKFKKNHLYMYQGGGYSGCIWEWNFFLIDDTGKFIDLFSSGCDGIKTEKQAIEYINDNANEINSAYYVYDLTSNESLFEFATKTNKGLVAAIALQVNNYYYTNDPVNFSHRIIYFICDKCYNRIFPESEYCFNFDATEYHWEHIYCENCGGNTCTNCGCVITDDYNLSINDDYLCKDCFDYTCSDILEGQQPLVMFQDYPKGQQNLFKEYSNSMKQITVTCNDNNRDEILEYLKKLGFEE